MLRILLATTYAFGLDIRRCIYALCPTSLFTNQLGFIILTKYFIFEMVSNFINI